MFLITYDFTEDKVRTQFAKFLERHGRRVQYSVFEVRNSPRLLAVIKSELDHNFKKRFSPTDSVMIYEICEGCQKKVTR